VVRIGLCFVCLGNICRSPAAAAVFAHLARTSAVDGRFSVESAGTGHWVGGDPPHPLAIAVGARRGYHVTGVSRRFAARDFDRFDLVLALDKDVYSTLKRWCRLPADTQKLSLLRSFSPHCKSDLDVPDPMGGEPSDFEETFDLCEEACAGLLEALRVRYGF
jgi:protein-tyrosine phosphatase